MSKQNKYTNLKSKIMTSRHQNCLIITKDLTLVKIVIIKKMLVRLFTTIVTNKE